MITKIMIDAGMRRRKNCTGRPIDGEDAELSPAYRIGEALADRLERAGYETLFSGNVPELSDQEASAGRPSVCAATAKKWGADCLIRLCVRAAELPTEARAEAMVYRGNSGAWSLGESVLQSLEQGCGMKSNGVRPGSGMLLLRRTVCPSMILVLQLPFRQKEQLSEAEVNTYAESVMRGIDVWAKTVGLTQGSTSRHCYRQA